MPVALASNLAVTGSGTLAFGSSITDNGNQLSLTMSGSNGTLILSGSNTYSGGTFLNAGTLLVSADNQLGTAPANPSANLTFNGGKLSFSAPMTLNANRSIQLNSGGGTLDTQGNNILYAGSISGSGGLTKTGSGTLTVIPYTSTSVNNTTIAQGTLRFQAAVNPPAFQNASFESPAIANNSYTYSLPAGLIWTGGGNAAVLIDNSTAWGYSIPYPDGNQAISLQRTGAISQTLEFASPGTYVLTFYSEERSGQTNPGAIYLDGGTTAVATWTAPSSTAWTQFSENITIAAAGTHSITFAGTTSGSDQSCAIDDIGLGANPMNSTYPTLLSFSSMNLANASSVLDVSGATTTIEALRGVAGSQVLISGGALTIAGPASSTFSGSIAGAGGSLTMNGSGTLMFSGSNTYSGGTFLNAGTLLVSADNQLGTAPASPAANLAFNGGKLSFSAPMTLNGNRSIQLNSGGGTLDTQGNNVIYGGSISGSGGLTKTGPGTLTLLPYTSTSVNNTTIAQGTLRFQIAANPPAFQNASFESPAIANNSYTYSLPAGLIWTGGGNVPVLIDNSAAWGYSIPYPDGDQAISLQRTGAISQTLDFTSPGTYVLTFYSEERGGQTNPARSTWTAVRRRWPPGQPLPARPGPSSAKTSRLPRRGHTALLLLEPLAAAIKVAPSTTLD